MKWSMKSLMSSYTSTYWFGFEGGGTAFAILVASILVMWHGRAKRQGLSPSQSADGNSSAPKPGNTGPALKKSVLLLDASRHRAQAALTLWKISLHHKSDSFSDASKARHAGRSTRKSTWLSDGVEKESRDLSAGTDCRKKSQGEYRRPGKLSSDGAEGRRESQEKNKSGGAAVDSQRSAFVHRIDGTRGQQEHVQINRRHTDGDHDRHHSSCMPYPGARRQGEQVHTGAASVWEGSEDAGMQSSGPTSLDLTPSRARILRQRRHLV